MVIYDDKTEKKLFGKSLITFLWSDIKEIRLDGVVIYISKKTLVGTKKEWDKKQYIFIFYTENMKEKTNIHILISSYSSCRLKLKKFIV